MILDPEDWGLAQEIEALLAAVPAELEGQVKPELFQSVLEIATKPCDGVRAAGRELAELRRAVIEITARAGPRDRRRGHAPVRALRATSRSSTAPATTSWSTSSARSRCGS